MFRSPSRSAIVRATFNTRWHPRGDRLSCSGTRAGKEWAIGWARRQALQGDANTGVFATLKRNDIDLDHWLHDWLTACAEAGGPPTDLTPWLPWSMTTTERERLQQPRAPPRHA